LLFGEWKVKEHVKLHLLHMYHIVIHSQLKYLIGAKVQTLRNCQTAQLMARLMWFSFLMGYHSLQWFQFGSNLDLELNCQFGTVATITTTTLQLGRGLCNGRHTKMQG
jgi:hypothetical protein